MDYHQPIFYKLNDDSTFLIKMLGRYRDDIINNPHILDLCAGCGFLGIESSKLFTRVDELTFVEIQAEFIPFIEKNCDIFLSETEVHILKQSFEVNLEEKFDLILCNPPYFEKSESRVSTNINKAVSRHFIHGELMTLFQVVLKQLKNSHSLGFILVRKDHTNFNKIKEKFKKNIINTHSKGRVELVILQDKQRD